jgi:hypothetical protein
VASGVQVHDFNPGIAANGLFWTTRIPPESVEIDLEEGRARYRLTDWAISDFTDIFNSIGVAKPSLPPIPSTVSFEVRCRGKASPVRISDATNRFRGRYIDSTATVAWSAREPSTNFAFVSDPASTSTTVSGVIGRERNGLFFDHQPGGDDGGD